MEKKNKNKNQAKVIQGNVVLCKTNFAINKTKICKKYTNWPFLLRMPAIYLSMKQIYKGLHRVYARCTDSRVNVATDAIACQTDFIWYLLFMLMCSIALVGAMNLNSIRCLIKLQQVSRAHEENVHPFALHSKFSYRFLPTSSASL